MRALTHPPLDGVQIRSILESFLHDPLVEWTKTEYQGGKAGGKEEDVDMVRSLVGRARAAEPAAGMHVSGACTRVFVARLLQAKASALFKTIVQRLEVRAAARPAAACA